MYSFSTLTSATSEREDTGVSNSPGCEGRDKNTDLKKAIRPKRGPYMIPELGSQGRGINNYSYFNPLKDSFN